MERYYEEVSDDILKTKNCAVYRDLHPELPRSREEMERTIGQMQLLVIPVTEEFLNCESRSRDGEFPMAVRLHKPVLFWAQTSLDAGLMEQFNEKCQKLQMLIKRDMNPEPVPYENKLEQFLNENLAGDRLTERVREAFPAYIFLSYRKKDRKYVRPLMEAIHRNEFCRDIAVWYDEFLTIGESFHAGIENAMKKSSLVTLLVTPNILEPDNYVKDNEYRDARRLPRPVVPVLAEETAPQALEEGFEGLPDCTALEDERTLTQRIRDGLEAAGAVSEADRASRDTPEHEYLIGEAYMNGIDVEADSERGSEMIIHAAERGHEEAAEKLAQMYRSGKGVHRDYQSAVFWQERLARMRQKACEEHLTREGGLRLVRAYQCLGDLYGELRDYPAAKQAYLRMQETGERLNAAYGAECAGYEFALSCAKLGDISRAEGSLDEAKEQFARCWEMSYEQRQGGGVNEAVSIGYCMGQLGGICAAEGDLAGAREYYGRQRTLEGWLADRRPGEVTRRNYAVNCEKLGDLALTEGLLEQAEEYYRESLQLYEKNAGEYQSESAYACLVTALAKMGDVHRAGGEFRSAKTYYERSLELCLRHVPSDSIEGRGKRSVSFRLLGLACLKLGEYEEARTYMEQAWELGRQLVEETHAPELLQDYSNSCSQLGDICMAEGKTEEAGQLYEQDLQLSRELADRLPGMTSLRNLAISCGRMGSFYMRQRNGEEAWKWFHESASLYEGMTEKMDIPDLWDALACEYFNIGLVSSGEEREAWGMKAYGIYKKLLRTDPDNDAWLARRDRVLEALL